MILIRILKFWNLQTEKEEAKRLAKRCCWLALLAYVKHMVVISLSCVSICQLGLKMTLNICSINLKAGGEGLMMILGTILHIPAIKFEKLLNLPQVNIFHDVILNNWVVNTNNWLGYSLLRRKKKKNKRLPFIIWFSCLIVFFHYLFSFHFYFYLENLLISYKLIASIYALAWLRIQLLFLYKKKKKRIVEEELEFENMER